MNKVVGKFIKTSSKLSLTEFGEQIDGLKECGELLDRIARDVGCSEYFTPGNDKNIGHIVEIFLPYQQDIQKTIENVGQKTIRHDIQSITDALKILKTMSMKSDETFNFPVAPIVSCLSQFFISQLKAKAKSEFHLFVTEFEQLANETKEILTSSLFSSLDPLKQFFEVDLLLIHHKDGFKLESIFEMMTKTLQSFSQTIVKVRLNNIVNLKKQFFHPDEIKNLIFVQHLDREEMKEILKERSSQLIGEFKLLKKDVHEMFSSKFLESVVKPALKCLKIFAQVIKNFVTNGLDAIFEVLKRISKFMKNSTQRVSDMCQIPPLLACIVQPPDALHQIKLTLSQLQTQFDVDNMIQYLQQICDAIFKSGLIDLENREESVEKLLSHFDSFIMKLSDIEELIVKLVENVDHMDSQVLDKLTQIVDDFLYHFLHEASLVTKALTVKKHAASAVDDISSKFKGLFGK